jgi:hypothetical protein
MRTGHIFDINVALLGMLSAVGCAVGVGDSMGDGTTEGIGETDQVESTEQPLVKTDPVWPKSTVSLCWDHVRMSGPDDSLNGGETYNGDTWIDPEKSPDFPTLRDIYEKAARERWGLALSVSFSILAKCPWNNAAERAAKHTELVNASKSLFAIRLYNTQGSSWNSVAGFHAGVNDIVYATDYGFDLLPGSALHEFGHTLGFHHEFSRKDYPTGTSCGDWPAFSTDFLHTPPDVNSVMNRGYCNNDHSDLSFWDVQGARLAYNYVTPHPYAFPFWAATGSHYAFWGEDWAPYGQTKMHCAPSDAVIGLSADASSGQARFGLCATNGWSENVNTQKPLPFNLLTDPLATPQTTVDATAEHGRGSDWDWGYVKADCPVDHVLTGIAQYGDGRLHLLRCTKLNTALYAESSACYRRILANSSSGLYGTNWDTYKSECSPGDYAIGVSHNVNGVSMHAINCCSVKVAKSPIRNDYDRDGRSDLVRYRPSNGTWYVRPATRKSDVTKVFGTSTDRPVPGDYDGDGRMDFAYYRPSDGTWHVLPSSGGAERVTQWGISADVTVAADYDGDGKTDYAVYRPAEANWFVIPSGGGATRTMWFGDATVIPTPGDYDGDGKADYAFFRPSEAKWYVRASTGGFDRVTQFGKPTDVPAPGDYDGDGKTDCAFYRPSEKRIYAHLSAGGADMAMGIGTDVGSGSACRPVPADYDGDGKTDLACYNTSTGKWYVRGSLTNAPGGLTPAQVTIEQFGSSTDLTPVSNAVR